MKILLSSFAFAPSVGGIETASAILAHEFTRAGHQVHVITETPGDETSQLEIQVTRQPSLARVMSLLAEHDLFFQNNISLRSLVPALALPLPKVVTHQTWLQDARGRNTWNNRLKRAGLPFVTNVAISSAVARDLQRPFHVIPNPFQHEVFKLRPEISRERELVFVGRLVSDKGADLLLRSLYNLKQQGREPHLTIVGRGPEEERLRRLAADLGVTALVDFVGEKSGEELARLLNAHRIIVVPSRWREPFGIVALEGIAAGCVAVGSSEGGLADAIGPCGILFPNDNEAALTAALHDLLRNPAQEERLRAAGPAHLEQFTAATIAGRYLELFHSLLQ